MNKNKGQTKSKSKKTFPFILVILFAFIILITYIFIAMEDKSATNIFESGNSTELSKYNLSKNDINFILENQVSNEVYEDLNKLYKEKEEFLVYFFSDKCGKACLNSYVVEELKSISENTPIKTFDYNKISELKFHIIGRSQLDIEGVNFVYVKNNIVTDYVVSEDIYSINSLPNTENNSYKKIMEYLKVNNDEEKIKQILLEDYGVSEEDVDMIYEKEFKKS